MLYLTLDYMIKASELRVGVWVNEKVETEDGYNLLPTKLDGLKINLFEQGWIKLEPIELTPEILEKARFESTSKGFFIHPQWYNLSLKYRNGTYNLRVNFLQRIATNIDYLHQLQNLFYSLVGEELTIDATLHSQATTEEK
jgi:hypothetical protein